MEAGGGVTGVPLPKHVQGQETAVEPHVPKIPLGEPVSRNRKTVFYYVFLVFFMFFLVFYMAFIVFLVFYSFLLFFICFYCFLCFLLFIYCFLLFFYGFLLFIYHPPETLFLKSPPAPTCGGPPGCEGAFVW